MAPLDCTLPHLTSNLPFVAAAGFCVGAIVAFLLNLVMPADAEPPTETDAATEFSHKGKNASDVGDQRVSLGSSVEFATQYTPWDTSQHPAISLTAMAALLRLDHNAAGSTAVRAAAKMQYRKHVPVDLED